MTDLNFHTEAITVVRRWGDRIQGKTGRQSLQLTRSVAQILELSDKSSGHHWNK
jgi:hypothetical protein